MKKSHNLLLNLLTILLYLPSFTLINSLSEAKTAENDASVMFTLKNSLNPPDSLGWTDPDPCKWAHVGCSDDKRVTKIQMGRQNLHGKISTVNFTVLTFLERLELQWNNLSGLSPNLKGLNFLQVIMLSNNNFTEISSDFFTGLNSLLTVDIDNNPFMPWVIPDSLKDGFGLVNFSANSAGLIGGIGVFGSGSFPSLVNLHLSFNGLEGELGSGFVGSKIESFWINGQKNEGVYRKFGGRIDVLQNMTSLREVWLHQNAFSGALPDFSGLNDLEVLSVRDNLISGVVPLSLMRLKSLVVVNLTNNLLQGPVPAFGRSVNVDLVDGTNSFCLSKRGECSPQVNVLLSVVESMDFPVKFAESWKGNDPCSDWFGIICSNGNITVVNFGKMGLNGSISPDLSGLKSLQRLILSDNNLTGTIPQELTTLPSLIELDVSHNQLHGKVPSFKKNLDLNILGNPGIGKNVSQITPVRGAAFPPSTSEGNRVVSGKKSDVSNSVVTVVCVVGAVILMLLCGVVGFCLYKRMRSKFRRVQSPNAMVVHPQHSGSDSDSVKITVGGSSVSVTGTNGSRTIIGTSDIQMAENGSMVISIQVLKNVTNNFSEDNILGWGGFGTVYKGELHDGTKIAVKRMECGGVITGKGLNEFKSEISVLSKVRHRHLVALLGYCLDGNEKLLVYEYMPQGTLSRYIFNWAEEGLKPLEWTRRLSIALDVARGVEYLHTLAHQSFIHRDLKPSNILLGDDLRAKVADFGLVRLAPEGKASVETRIAGTFGYLAPEYAVTGRVTTKVDVFSFGVILMELITGRKALDETQPEESMHLVTWFKKMHLNKETFQKAIDTTLDLTEETLASISTVAELAGHCCAREPYQRPDMGHTVNILSSLVERWKPEESNFDDCYGIDLDMSLPQALKQWKDSEASSQVDSCSSSYVADNTHTSMVARPYGFAESFTSADGR